MKLKGLTIILLISVSITLSFFFSREIYTFYNRIYYKIVVKADYREMLNRAKDLYKKRRYKDLDEHLRVMALIFDEDPEFNRLKGLNLIRLGRDREGVQLVLSALKNGKVGNDTLNEVLEILAEDGLYNDLIKIFEENNVDKNGTNLFYYGLALFKTGRYKGSINVLQKAAKSGAMTVSQFNRAGIYYYMGLALEAEGNLTESLKNLRRAKEIDGKYKNLDKSLVRVYAKLGRYSEAEKLIRRKKI